MGLVRVTTQLATTIVRKLGDDGGTLRRDVEAELDTIFAWAKLSPRCIHRDTAAVGNVGAGLDTLHTFSLPANSLQADGDYLHMRYGGSFANTEADKQIQVQLDGQAVSSFGGVIDIENGSWAYDIYSVRTSSTTVRSSVMATLVSVRKADGALVVTPSGGFIFAQNTLVTVNNLNTNSMALTVFGEGTNNDDVVQNLSIIELTQQ